MEARLVPGAGCEDVGETSAARHASAIAVVERREAEADEVRRAEVADDAAVDQRLHDRVACGCANTTWLPRAASRGLASVTSGSASTFADEQLGQAARALASRSAIATPVEGRRARLRARPAPGSTACPSGHRAMPSAGAIARHRRRKGSAWPIQPGSGVAQLLLQIAGDEHEGRRAGAAVQIFIAAADREIAAVSRRGRPQAPRRCATGPTGSARPRRAPRR